MGEDMGLAHSRLEGEEYISLIDEFMDACFTRWPDVIVQVSAMNSEERLEGHKMVSVIIILL